MTGGVYKEVLDALQDDMNTAVALAAIFGCLKGLNDLLHTKKVKKVYGWIPNWDT